MTSENSNEEQWLAAVKEELAIMRKSANRPCPEGMDTEIWEGICAMSKAQIPVLRAILGDLNK
jgi:hypothetical protein